MQLHILDIYAKIQQNTAYKHSKSTGAAIKL